MRLLPAPGPRFGPDNRVVLGVVMRAAFRRNAVSLVLNPVP